MKYLLLSLFISFVCCDLKAQDAINYSITPNYVRSIEHSQLNSAKTIKDINPGFPASWISTYISTEIITIQNQLIQKAIGFNDTLSIEQLNQLSKVDIGSEIKVNVKYIPDNSLSKNEAKEIDFAYTVIPENEAQFVGGEIALNEYLEEMIVIKIPQQQLDTIEMIEVNFDVTKNGEIKDVLFSRHSKDDAVNELIFQSISEMPKWIPAKTRTGILVKQSFQFRIGTTVGC